MPAVKRKPALRLNQNMRNVLKAIIDGKGLYHGCEGRSEHGGRDGTLYALRRRGMLDSQNNPTAEALGVFAPPAPIPSEPRAWK